MLLINAACVKSFVYFLQSLTQNVVRCAAYALSNLARDKETTKLVGSENVFTSLYIFVISCYKYETVRTWS